MTVSLVKREKCEHEMCSAYAECLFAGKVFVNVYELSQEYGGPEEGGWWVTCGEFITGRVATTETVETIVSELETEYPERSNGRPYYSVVYNGGDYRVYVEDKPGADFPEVFPHYE